MSDEAKVVTTDFMPRTLFRGVEADARKFISENFPRLHVQPGTDYAEDLPTPNVHLVLPNGNKEFLHGDAGWVQHKDNKDEDTSLDLGKHDADSVDTETGKVVV